MPSQLRRSALLSLTLAAIALGGCGPDTTARATPPAAAPASKPARPEAVGDLVSVSEADGVVLAELPVGSAAGLEAGSFLRVYAAADPHRLKGMMQITEILAPGRSIARLIALSDRQDPLAPGDHAHEVADLAMLADGAAIEGAARAEQGRQRQADAADQQRFAALREQYQRELAAAELRYDAQLRSVREQYEGQLKAADAGHAHDLQLKQLELRTDLAALKTTLAEQVAAGIAADHQASEQRIAALSGEKTALQGQVDGLLKQQGDLSARIAGLVKELAEHDRAHADELRAEVETREVLAARIGELEARMAGRAAPTVGAVLSSDPQRGETVLQRLARLGQELTAERDRAKRLEASLAEASAALAAAKDANRELDRQVKQLGPAGERAASLAADLDATRTRLAEAEKQRDALELQRLEAERTLYDLASRVLRLAGSSPETVALQARLRDVLGADDAAAPTAVPAPAPAAPAGKTP